MIKIQIPEISSNVNDPISQTMGRPMSHEIDLYVNASKQ